MNIISKQKLSGATPEELVRLATSGLVRKTDVDDTPRNGAIVDPISSNWAYDHVAAADPHTSYTLITNGTYAGDSSVNRAIPHGLGQAPKVVFIQEVNVGDFFVVPGGAVFIYSSLGALGVTALNATNFYVGNATNYIISANSSVSSRFYYWWALT